MGEHFPYKEGVTGSSPVPPIGEAPAAVPGTFPPMFGRKPKQPEQTRIVGDAGTADGPAQDLFDITLNSAGDTPWAVAQAISTGSIPTRDNISVKQAKALIDRAPTTIAERVDSPQAQRLKVALEAAGAEFQIVPHGASAS